MSAVEEQEGQPWAADMAALLRAINAAVDAARDRGKRHVPAHARVAFRRRYAHLIATDVAASPPPERASPRRGRRKQSKAKNLLDRLQRPDEVRTFINDVAIPFDNNQAERDVPMVKGQQKASGAFLSVQGGPHPGYLSTLPKQGYPLLAALESLFRGHPLVPCLASCIVTRQAAK